MLFNRMIRNLFFIFIYCFIFASSVYGDYNYTEAGNQNGFFKLGVGFWNEDMDDYDSTTRVITDAKQLPLISDLDDDNISEIIVLDGVDFRLYEGQDLNIVDSFSPYDITEDRLSNFITFDIDDDEKKEVIVYDDASKVIHIMEYNGTAFFTQNNFTCNFSTNLEIDESIIGCGDDNCLLVAGVNRDGTNKYTEGIGFNSTSCSSNRSFAYGTYIFECFSTIKRIAYADYDNDGIGEYIVSVLRVFPSPSSDETAKIYYIRINDSLDPILEQTITSLRPTNLIESAGVPTSCRDTQGKINDEQEPISRYITSPLVFDFDGSPSNGLETLIGMSEDRDEFKIVAYRSSGSELDDYPEIFDADGMLVSDVMRGNIFESSGESDVCVLGYEHDDQEVDLLCASIINGDVSEFKYDTSSLYNVSLERELWSTVTHMTEQNGNTITDEILTSYGVFEIDFVGINELFLIFENPYEDSALISVDAERVGRDDLIALTDTNLWYIDDKYTNVNAEIQSITTNPSILITIAENTTVQTTLTITDEEFNEVRGTLIAYEGHYNEQKVEWSSLVPSGTTIPITFEANVTVAVGELTFYATDSEHDYDENVSVTYFFSVSKLGHGVGDSYFESGDLLEEEEEEDFTGEYGTNYTSDDNIIREAVIEQSNNAKVTPFLFMIILMFLLNAFLVIFLATKGLVKLGIALSIVCDLFIVLVFTDMELIPPTTIIIMFFLIIVGGILFFISKMKRESE